MEITSEQLNNKIKNGESIIVDFYGTFCGPCKIMKPWFEKVANEQREIGGTQLYTFNIETDKEYVVNEMGIRSVPTIKGFKGGSEVHHSVGILTEEKIKALVQKIILL